MSQTYDFSINTPVDNTYSNYNIFKSGIKNIKFIVAFSTTYTISEADMANLPGIAYNLYDDVSAWAIILRFNGLNDAIQDVYAGLVLNIPDKSSVIAYISQQASNVPVVLNL